MATATSGPSHKEWLKEHTPGWLPPIAAALAGIEALLLLGQAGLIALILERALVQATGTADLTPLLVGLAGVAIGRAMVLAARGMIAERASASIRQDLRKRLVHRLCLSDPTQGSEFQTGALAHQVVDRVDRLDPYFSRFLPQQYSALLIPLLIVLTVGWVNWLAGLVLAIAAPIIPAFMALIGIGAERLSRDQASVTARLSGLFHDRLRGLSTIQRFGAADRVIGWLSEAAEDYQERTMKVLRLAFLSSAVLEFFAAVAIASLAIYIGLSLLGIMDIGPSNHLTLASGLFILLLAPDFFLALRQLAQHWHDRADALAAAADLRPLFDRPIVAQPASAELTPAPSPAPSPAPALSVESLSFAYPGAGALFNRFELKIEPEERLLITGPSGCGKSTLLMLLAGLSRPDAGVIRYGAQDIAHLDDAALSRWRAWLNQNSVIFDRSLRDNLTLGRLGFEDQALNRLLELCGLGRLVSELNQGLETRLGNDGARLSGGQARRIALARTLLEPRPILLLDEPSEHLDPDSEEALWTAIEKIGNQHPMTVVAVSHRPRARQWAERIVDLGRLDPSREGAH